MYAVAVNGLHSWGLLEFTYYEELTGKTKTDFKKEKGSVNASLRIVYYLEAFAFPEREICRCSRFVVIQCHKRCHATCRNKKGQHQSYTHHRCTLHHNKGLEWRFSPARVILFDDVMLLLSTPPNSASSAVFGID